MSGGRGGCKMGTDRPTSNAGDAIGPSSVVIENIPSNGRSGYGFVTSAETREMTLPDFCE